MEKKGGRKMKQKAFTLLELVFVIVIIGILSALAIPSFQTNVLQQATEQVASHIRYAQHLAIVDDKFSPTDQTYQNKRWRFTMNGNTYTVTDSTDTAIDPLTSENISVDLEDAFNTTATDAVIQFDHLGRPYNNGGLLAANATMTLTHDEGTATITIHRETGYVQVVYNN